MKAVCYNISCLLKYWDILRERRTLKRQMSWNQTGKWTCYFFFRLEYMTSSQFLYFLKTTLPPQFKTPVQLGVSVRLSTICKYRYGSDIWTTHNTHWIFLIFAQHKLSNSTCPEKNKKKHFFLHHLNKRKMMTHLKKWTKRLNKIHLETQQDLR